MNDENMIAMARNKNTYPFTQPNRLLRNKKAGPEGLLDKYSLSVLRDDLAFVATKQAPMDHERTLNQLHMDFTQGWLEASWLGPNGLEDTRYLVTNTAAHQLASMLLPPRFFGGLRELAGIDPAGSRLATMCWMKFSSLEAEKPRLVRTQRQVINQNDIRYVIRSVHSQGYAAYSNIEFVEDIMKHGGELAHLPVLGFTLSDNGMRIRFAVVDEVKAVFGSFDHSVILNEPIPMIEVWNSETGCARTRMSGGMYKLQNMMGLGHWDDKTEYGWIHRGDPDRISRGVGEAFRNLVVVANKVVEAYKEATDIAIDNAFEWMEAELRGSMPESKISKAQSLLTSPLVTPGGSLASVVDSLCLRAQEEEDIYDQYEMEKIASKLLLKGRGQALKSGGKINVEGD